ncbi:MAG TPA: hypothetical protein EYN66_00800, partial [Myxococcales bacterium]|nr:hypothetical protein [Myxococcales bacterium]
DDGTTDDGTTDDGTTDLTPVDPCDPNPCQNNGTCSVISSMVSEAGEAVCDCADTGFEGKTCETDVDECTADPNPCADTANTNCSNNDGGYDCNCSAGYEADADAACADVDECTADPSPCADTANTSCTNNDGGYDCNCSAGYEADADGACADVDECTADPSPCADTANSTCTNNDGGYECACNAGYKADADGACADVDECGSMVDPCADAANSTCTNSEGGYECACDEGFELGMDNICYSVDDGPSAQCKSYCELAATSCLNEDAIAFGGKSCEEVCAGFPDTGKDGDVSGNTVQCRITQLTVAATMDAPSYCAAGAPESAVCLDKEVVLGDTCENAIVLENGPVISVSGDTTTANPDYSTNMLACAGLAGAWGSSSNDLVYAFTPATDGTYKVTLLADYDSLLYILDGCGAEMSCLGADDQIGTGLEESVVVDLVTGTTIYVVVDGYNNNLNEAGSFTLTVEAYEKPFIVKGANCDDPFVVDMLPFKAMGDTTTMTNDFSSNGMLCNAFDNGNSSSDLVYTYTAVADG